MHSLIRIFIVLCAVGIPALSQAAAQFFVDGRLQQQELAPYLFALEEPAGGMGIDEARRQFAAGRFVPTDSKNSFNKGVRPGNLWVDFDGSMVQLV
jgi:hypothetical protein